MSAAPKFTIRRQGRQWGIYRDGALVEGGFFYRDSAIDRLAEWRGELSSSSTPRVAA